MQTRRTRRVVPVLVSTLVLGAGGFAAASIASGGALHGAFTATTGLTGTGPLPSRITICHHTGSKKHPSHALTINRHAWPAHARHGDTLGPCTKSPAQTGALTIPKHGNGNGDGNQGAQAHQEDETGNGAGHGNGNGQGLGHGHP